MTHGHEDHIGALPYLYQYYEAPIYTTPWTAELIYERFNSLNFDKPEIIILKPTTNFNFGSFNIALIHMNHSIPDSCSVHIDVNEINIFHTGDFKLDDNPLYSLSLIHI